VVLSPTLVQGGRTFSQLDAGGAHTCGRSVDGVYCWGDNGSGQVGIYEGSTQLPVRVTGQP
jgi:alpha-tubulin suppressor-like RCC1 family protein